MNSENNFLIDSQISDTWKAPNHQSIYDNWKSGLLPTVTVGGMECHALTRIEWAELIISISQKRDSSACPWFTSINGQVISDCARNPSLFSLFSQSSGIAVDGQPLVFASKLLGKSKIKIPERSATTDLFHDVASLAQDMGISFYMLGAKEGTIEKAVKNVMEIYPNLKIIGSHHGYINDPLVRDSVINEINSLNPDILWVSMGVPKEQEFCSDFSPVLKNVGIIKTSGGLFDFLSGEKSRAPTLMQKIGLEWAYRLFLEPRRLFKRYAFTNFHAIWLLLTKTE